MSKISLVARILSVMLILLLLQQGSPARGESPARAAAPASGNTLVVNSTQDTPDADVLNPACADASGKCSLRAAIMLADFLKGSSTIVLPKGVYTLTRPGYDNNSEVGDLDISANLKLQGAGSGATIVDGNGAVTGDRAFKVLDTAGSVTLSGLTIRNGVSLSSTVGTIGGGGLLMEGAGNLTLSDVDFEDNTGQNGGGLYVNFTNLGGSLSMDHVTLHANKALAGGVGEGGGLFVYLPSASSLATVQNSLVYSNTADGTGGGAFIEGATQAQWQVTLSQFYSNTADSGGAIGNFVPLSLSDSVLRNNRASSDGGAIEAFSPVSILRSTLSANSAARYGGAIFSLSTGNSASPEDFLDINQSTLSYNYAHDGGAIYHDGYIDYNALLTLTNSTLS
ncbi:MAG TPA: CSLREA domain-containing protein, partial [Anaerolineales bacterium]